MFRTFVCFVGVACLVALASPSMAVQVVLQNASATYSQGYGGQVDATIDGNFAGNNGWAIEDGDGTNDETAVYETAVDDLLKQYTFTLSNVSTDNPTATVGKFRISLTTDDRSTFADGPNSGGDVSAMWIQLVPTSAIATNGTTLTINLDNTILASGTNPSTSVYTVTAHSALLNVTGFRLEVFTDASLPDNGPGRALNGNFVLTEFSVDAIPEPGSAAALIALGLAAVYRRTKR
jgi:hypothetical protein